MNEIFANTNYYKKIRYWENSQQAYWTISPFSDGNCGLYAFACGLVDIIITDKITLSTQQFDVFRNTILEHCKSIKNKFQTQTIYPDILKFLTVIERPTLTFSEFKNVLIEQTRQGLAAINLLLAQPLRTIGVSQYCKAINVDQIDGCLLAEDEALLENGVWVGDDILSSLAKYFGINIRLIGNDDTTFETPLPENATPLFSLLNQANHWHYLLPEAQSDGLAKILPFAKTNIRSQIQQHTSQRLLKNNQQLLQEIEKDYLENSLMTALTRLSTKLKQIFYYLKEIFVESYNASNENELKIASLQANIAVHNSTKALDTLRQTWEKAPNQLDKKLNLLGLQEIEKALIKGPLITDNSRDATVATVLQNAEIAGFFSRNYALLTSGTPTTIQTPTCKL